METDKPGLNLSLSTQYGLPQRKQVPPKLLGLLDSAYGNFLLCVTFAVMVSGREVGTLCGGEPHASPPQCKLPGGKRRCHGGGESRAQFLRTRLVAKVFGSLFVHGLQ